MWLCKRDLSKECKGGYRSCTDCVLDNIRDEIEEYKSRQLTLAMGVDDLEEGKQIALEYVIAIINKYDRYKTGSGDKE